VVCCAVRSSGAGGKGDGAQGSGATCYLSIVLTSPAAGVASTNLPNNCECTHGRTGARSHACTSMFSCTHIHSHTCVDSISTLPAAPQLNFFQLQLFLEVVLPCGCEYRNHAPWLLSIIPTSVHCNRCCHCKEFCVCFIGPRGWALRQRWQADSSKPTARARLPVAVRKATPQRRCSAMYMCPGFGAY
jgi:hypothetical protein